MAIPDKLHVDIVTPERRVLARDVDEVILPGVDGSFGVLPGHAPLLAGLGPGLATVRTGQRSEVLAISGGFADVGPERVTVLAETCERAEEIDIQRARAEIAELQQRVAQEIPPDEDETLRRRLGKQQARVAAAEKA